MALAIISSIATAGALTPIAIMTLIPLIAIGMNYYSYQAYDPESKIIDAPYVSDTLTLQQRPLVSFSLTTFLFFLAPATIRLYSGGRWFRRCCDGLSTVRSVQLDRLAD